LGWFISLVMESNGDGHHLAPFSSPANTYKDIVVDTESLNLTN
jgi:hypothetical protein